MFARINRDSPCHCYVIVCIFRPALRRERYIQGERKKPPRQQKHSALIPIFGNVWPNIIYENNSSTHHQQRVHGERVMLAHVHCSQPEREREREYIVKL